MSNQQAGLKSNVGTETESSILALLFFAMGALHIYGMMRSRSKRNLLAKKATISIISSPSINNFVTVGLVVVALALIRSILVF